MFRTILELFVEFCLWLEDDKHVKHIAKKEKQDGKSRFFQKHVLMPSTYTSLVSVIIIGGVFICLLALRTRYAYPKATKQELNEMMRFVEAWKENYGTYPEHLADMIGLDPIRKAWKKDAWSRPYRYSLVNSGEGVLIASSGKDGVFNTDDDIVFKSADFVKTHLSF